MAEEISKIADWAPGTLDKTRKNIGDISDKDAASMVKKLGGEVMYERSSASTMPSAGASRKGAIVRNTASGGGNGGSGAKNAESHGASESSSASTPRHHAHETLPPISKKTAASIDKLMMSLEYKIKPNYGFFNFVRTLQKNGSERINPAFYEFTMKQQLDHIESFITVIKTLIQIAPSTYKTKIANGSEPKFKFLRMVAAWSVQSIKLEYLNVQEASKPVTTADLIPITRAFYQQLITVYYYGAPKIPKLIKEIFADELAYPDAPKDKISEMAKQAITEWLYLENEIIKKLYPLLMRMCSDTYEVYPDFFRVKTAEILKFVGLHKFDLLLPEKPKEEEKPVVEEKPKRPEPPQKGVKDSSVITGIKLLNQLFPGAGFDVLDIHPDMYPYFQPLFRFEDGFNMLSPENPMQVLMVLHKIIEECIQGCRNIRFAETEDSKNGVDSIQSILDEWAAYREDSFEKTYCKPLCDLTNSVYSQPDYMNSHIGKKTMNALLWQVTYQFMPNFKFDQLILEHPANENKYRPLFHRTDFARKYLTQVINECDAQAANRGPVQSVENPWEHYSFGVPNQVSKRLDVLLGAQNRGANTNATNANLLKYTLCFISVLDWWINNPISPAYATDPMHVFRISTEDGKPQFSVPERSDQNKLFAEAVKASYQKKAN